MKRFLEELQSNGIYTFSREKVKEHLNVSESALKKLLQRYEKKGYIVKLRRKFYLIIPIEYKKVGIIPPFWFIDDLMKYLNIKYYVGLVTAAGIYGSSHQQPQIFQVIVNKQLPSIRVKQLQIDFITKLKITKDEFIESKKSETGMFKVSSPELTCFDLVKYMKRAGGINEVVSIIDHLKNRIDNNKLKKLANSSIATVHIQRLGYIFKYLGDEQRAQILKSVLKNKRYFPALLIPDEKSEIIGKDRDFHIVINYKIEVDEI